MSDPDYVPFDEPIRRDVTALHIRGIEITQSMQYFQDDGHPSIKDNSMPLVAGKPALVRVYLNNQQWVSTPGSVYYPPGCKPSPWEDPPCAVITPAQNFYYHGTLEVGFSYALPVYTKVLTLYQQVWGYKDSPIFEQRCGGHNTMNFAIPASVMRGRLHFLLTLRLPDGKVITQELETSALLRQTLRVRGIMVRYNGPDKAGKPLDLPAPTLADLKSSFKKTLQMFPVQSSGQFSSCAGGVVTWSTSLETVLGWTNLVASLAHNRFLDGNHQDVVYFGIVPGATPLSEAGGLAHENGMAASVNHFEDGFAHELGHLCGLPHAPCGSVNDPLIPWPHDKPGFVSASIGGVGAIMDSSLSIFSPKTITDIMSYCPPRWISLEYYRRLIQHPKLYPEHPTFLPKTPLLPAKPWPIPLPYPKKIILVTGLLHSPRELEVKKVTRLETHVGQGELRATGLVAELIGKDGSAASRASIRASGVTFHGACGCGGGDGASEYPKVFHAFLPDVERGKKIRIRLENEELWSRSAPATKPRLRGWKARVVATRQGHQVEISWQADHAEDVTPEAWVRWTTDKGETWRAFVTEVPAKASRVDAAHLPAGKVTLQLMLSDGFDTIAGTPITVIIPRRNPVVTLFSPGEDVTLPAGDSTRFWAAATGDDGLPVPDEDAEWLINGKSIGKGLDVIATVPPRGSHKAVLAISSNGRKFKREFSFKSESPEGPA